MSIKDLFTGIDGQTQDMGRWSWAICTGGVLAAAASNSWHGATIDLMGLGAALTGVAAGHGYAIAKKADTEPR